jgi:hypothetical protein
MVAGEVGSWELMQPHLDQKEKFSAEIGQGTKHAVDILEQES